MRNQRPGPRAERWALVVGIFLSVVIGGLSLWASFVGSHHR